VRVVDVLQEWLPKQRWFAGKGRAFEIAGVESLGWLNEDGPHTRIELVSLRYADGGFETYQVPLEYRSEQAEHLGHALVGQVDEGGEPRWVYDALHDKEVTGAWTRGMHDETRLRQVVFRRERATHDFPVDEPSLVIGAEQSNTSLVYGDAIILKVFRRVSPGQNPDVELHHALAKAGSTDVAPLLGWMEGSWTDPRSGEEASGTLAMAQEFLRSATGGWESALTSVRDLYAEGDLHADEVGGDFAAEAHRLGAVTASVHADLARTMGTAEFAPDDLGELVHGMRERLDEATAAVAELAEYAGALGKAYDDLAAYGRPVRVQRVHGDLHLGQTMRALDGWKLIDFEGEPARPLSERRALNSPLRDVAGMLRSFDYAARHLLLDRADPHLEYRAMEWVERNCDAFCEGYGEANGRDPRADAVLLRAFEIDKVVYEVVYEARNRPSWLPIPMAAVGRLAA
jgi:maltokinase